MQNLIQGYRLSPQQRRLWSLYRLNHGAGYGGWLVLRITGPVDVKALKQAVEAVAAQNEILRTQFRESDEAALQVILEQGVHWRADRDWSALSAVAVQNRLRKESLEILGQPLELGDTPLLRASLITIAAQKEYLLSLDAPGLVADAPTLYLLGGWIGKAYAAILSNETIAPAAPQYADLAEWWNKLLEPGEDAEDRSYWEMDRSDSGAAPVRFPLERAVRLSPVFLPRYFVFRIEAELRQQIKNLATSLKVDLRDLLLACWFILLHRSHSQPRTTIAVGCNGRGYEDLKDGLGLFGRYLPITVQLSGDNDLRDVVQSVSVSLRDAERFIHGFEWNGAETEKNADRFPAFHYDFQEAAPPRAYGGAWFATADCVAVTERSNLGLVLQSDGDALTARLFFDANCLSARNAFLMGERFIAMMKHLAREPETPVDKLPIAGARERRRLVYAFNRPCWTTDSGEPVRPSRLPMDRCIHELFEIQAEHLADATALIFEQETLSYGELNRRANRLAWKLRSLGAGPETPIGMCAERSVEMAIGMLAIFKSGGVYVPLDANYPRERLGRIVANARIRVLLAQKELNDKLPEHAVPCVWLDSAGEERNGAWEANPAVPLSAENLAYVIYTSGSTGEPKGVMLTHGGIRRQIAWMQQAFPLGTEDRVLQKTTIGIDISIWECFAPWLAGGTVVMAKPGGHQDPEYIVNYLREQRITALQVVPTELSMMFEQEGVSDCRSLRRVYCGGEKLSQELVRQFYRRLPETRLYNVYGSTETTIDATCAECRQDEEYGAPSMGKPIMGAQIYVLDSDGEPAPVGCPGELYVGGKSLARGYLNAPEITAAHFVPNHLGGPEGARLYRTGDMARFRADGALEYLGRTDHQVKVRGFRIELGELETALMRHEQVKGVRVVARPGTAGNLRLIAYVAQKQRSALTSSILREYSASQLPDYCVPSVFVVVDDFPLNRSGKIDMEALSRLEQEQEELRVSVGPRTSVEKRLLELWQEILETENLGITDNFFEVNGNSFLAVRLMALIDKTFGRKLPLATVISSGTVEKMAALISDAAPVDRSFLVPIQTKGSLPPLFCAHPGNGSVICYHALAQHLGPDQPVYGLQSLEFDLQEGDLEISIEEMAARYVKTILAMRPQPQQFALAGWSFGGSVAFEIARQFQELKRFPVVILFDCRVPITTPEMAALDPALVKASILFEPAERVSANPFALEELINLNLDEQLALVSERSGVPVENLVPKEIGLDRLQRYLDMRIARNRAIEEYVLRPYYGKVVLYRAASLGRSAQIPVMQEIFERAAETSDYHWGQFCPGGLETITVAGDHDTILAPPHVQHLARDLTNCLARYMRQAG